MSRGKRNGLQRTRKAGKALPAKEPTAITSIDKARGETKLYEQYVDEMKANSGQVSRKLLASIKSLLSVMPAGKYEYKVNELIAGSNNFASLQVNIIVKEKAKKIYRPAQKEILFEINFAERIKNPTRSRNGYPALEFTQRQEVIAIKRPDLSSNEIQYARNNGSMLSASGQIAITDLPDLEGTKAILEEAIPAIYERNVIPKLAWERVTTNTTRVGSQVKRTTNPLLRK